MGGHHSKYQKIYNSGNFSIYQVAYVYTPEVYPTTLRAIGVGSCSSMARFGAMLTPYIAQVLLSQSFQGAIAVYSATTLLATACCLLLPIETKDREMGGSKG